MFCRLVHSDGGSGGGGPVGWMDGGEDREEAQSDVLLTAVCHRLHCHCRSAKCMDALHWQGTHRPRQWSHIARCPGNKLLMGFFTLFFEI